MAKDIRFEDFTVSFPGPQGPSVVADHISVVFPSGKITGLIGESGSGKSVMGMSVLQLLPSSAKIQGHCYYGDEDLLNLPSEKMRRIRGQEIAIIPQNPAEAMNSLRKIGGQLTETPLAHRLTGKREAKKTSTAALRKFGLERADTIMGQYNFEMSGGMNQRILTVMGLSCQPSWLIADEPTKGLDAIIRGQVMETLKQAAEESAGSMLVITHDLKLAQRLCDEICVLYRGHIVEHRITSKIFSNPLHPYTRGLLAAMPENGMHPIPGMSDTKHVSDCCPFFRRCPQCREDCRKALPPLFETADQGKVRCFFYAGSTKSQ
ncbi:MAG: ABC transporter ATP-binding protein [Candidatus Limivivens sp.]|nr:ABC transporter ATP-binding protein [Candidatus Limivivens sp.]